MSNPYVQVEIDALKKAPLLASALGIQMREAVGGLVLMWAHIYGEGRSAVVSAFYLRTFFGVSGNDVGEALVELGFLEPTDDGWRVKGAGRYTRLTEVRREAGRAGRQKQLGKTNDNSATSGQNPGKRDFAKDLPGQTPGKSAEVEALPGPTLGKSDEEGVLPGQKRALDPRSDISSPKGEERYRRSEDQRGVRKPASPLSGGQATHRMRHPVKAMASARREEACDPDPPPPPRPKREPLKPGTPEYDLAVREDDWEALGWEPMR